ncbi:MAG: hypothetical protein SGPRY_014372, partial [Prymnesium sp.]
KQKTESSISDFTLLRKLSAGGVGQVWLSKKKQTGDYFAIKVMRKAAIRKLKLSQSVNVEKEILAKHASPFLVRGYFAFRSLHHIYFALEFLPGGDLLGMLRNCGCVPENMARFYLAEVMLGLEYLHNLKILHRDIKPSNVLIAASGHIKLADFGLASSASRLKQCGTVPYVAPEMIVEASADASLDLWAAGVLFYELIVGDVPFKGETPMEVLESINTMPIGERPGLHVTFTPEALDFLMGLLIVDPKQRLGVADFKDITCHRAHPSKRSPPHRNPTPNSCGVIPSAHPTRSLSHVLLAAVFEGIPWSTLHQETPPFIPMLSHPGDTTYFDDAGPILMSQDTLTLDSSASSSAEHSENSESEFDHITHVNVDHLVELTRNAASTPREDPEDGDGYYRHTQANRHDRTLPPHSP